MMMLRRRRFRAPYVAPAEAESGLPAWMTAAIGEWAQISGTSAPSALKDYSGVALRDDETGVTLYNAAPGGHSGNYTDNSVSAIVLSADSPSWSTLLAASNTTGTNLGTGGGGSGADEVMASDGHPTPRHTYTDINWVPEIERVMIGGEAGGQNGEGSTVDHFGFDPAANDWDAQGTWTNRPNFRAYPLVRDPATGKRWAFYNTGSPNQGYEFNPAAVPPTWTLRTWTGGTDYTATRGAYAWDSTRSQIFHLSGGGWFTQAAGSQAQVLNPATLARTNISFNSSDGWTDFQANSGKFVGSALVYDEAGDCFYFYNGNTGSPVLTGQGAKVYKITPNNTATWDMEVVAVTGVTPAAETNNSGAYNKFFFVPRWRALFLAVGGQSLYYMRLPLSVLLSVTSGSVTGDVPYTATVIAKEGEVPSGYTLESPDDASMRASILSTHSDGSAAVVVVAGSTTVAADSTKTLHVRTVAASADTPLTAARIETLVTSVAVDFDAYGSASITDFSSPAHTWWANSKVITARYVLPAPSPGSTALEAVIDVTAFADSDRALVEVVVENGKIDALNSTGTGKPADADYTDATVTINGSTAATVSSSAAPTGTHQAFRAWYAKAWIGGDPEVRATQSHVDLQRHPLLWRCDKENTADISAYASDAYTPWSTGRHRASNMGGTGDHDSIGPLPKWEAHALQTGDAGAWNATEASALAILSYNVNYRDNTDFVPSSARMTTKYTHSTPASGSWPYTSDGSNRGTWENAHQPAAGLMAFLSRPSPVFIEIAQKIAVTTGTLNNDPARIALSDLDTLVGLTDLTGCTALGQTRAFAWGMRNTTHATFLSPDGSAWKTGGRVWLGRYVRWARAYQLNANAQNLRMVWDGGPGSLSDHLPEWTGYQAAPWMNYFLVGEVGKLARSGLVTDATEAGYLSSFADWFLTQPVRWVTDQADGGWRFVRYSVTYRKADNTEPTSYDDQMAYDISGSGPSTVSGGWGGLGASDETSWATIEGFATESSSGATYPTQFMYALVAAVERGVTGADTAWATVLANITDLGTWRAGGATEPRWSSWPRPT